MDSSDIEFKTESIKQDYQNATIKDDFDAILRKYDIKMINIIPNLLRMISVYQ